MFFGSLLFDFDQVEWLRAAIADIPLRFVFESALELMSCTTVGSFQVRPVQCLHLIAHPLQRIPLRPPCMHDVLRAACHKPLQMASTGGQRAGPPPAVKKVLSLFGSGREEDRLTGYLSMLKIGPKMLQWVPGQRARDLRHWLTVYSYWNQGGLDNVVAMCAYIVNEFFDLQGAPLLQVSDVCWWTFCYFCLSFCNGLSDDLHHTTS